MGGARGSWRDAEAGSLAGTFAYVLLGPLAWAAHLAVIYGVQPVLCGAAARGALAIDSISVVVIAATAAALAVPALALWRPGATRRLLRVAARREAEIRFQDSAMRWLCGLSAAGILWAGAAAFAIAPCVQLR